MSNLTLLIVIIVLLSISFSILHGAIDDAVKRILHHLPAGNDLSDLETKVEEIYESLGIKEKLEEKRLRDEKVLRQRLIELLIAVDNKPATQARNEVNRIFEETEPYRIESLVAEKENELEIITIEAKNREKYGRLLDQAEKYIKTHKHIKGMIDALGIDQEGVNWLSQQLGIDPTFEEVVELIANYDTVSISLLQRRFSIGYARASMIFDQLNQKGFITNQDKSKPGKVIKEQVTKYIQS